MLEAAKKDATAAATDMLAASPPPSPTITHLTTDNFPTHRAFLCKLQFGTDVITDVSEVTFVPRLSKMSHTDLVMASSLTSPACIIEPV